MPYYPGDREYSYRDFLSRVASSYIPFLAFWVLAAGPVALLVQAFVNDSVFLTHPAKNNVLYFLIGFVIWIALAPLCFGFVWRWRLNVKFTHDWEHLLRNRKVRFRYTPLFTASAPFTVLWTIVLVAYLATH